MHGHGSEAILEVAVAHREAPDLVDDAVLADVVGETAGLDQDLVAHDGDHRHLNVSVPATGSIAVVPVPGAQRGG